MHECCSDMEFHKTEFKWTIKKFSLFLKPSEEIKLVSPSFPVKDESKTEWKLKINFNEKESSAEKYITISAVCEKLDYDAEFSAWQVYNYINDKKERVQFGETKIKKYIKGSDYPEVKELCLTKKELKECSFLNDEFIIICQMNVMDNITTYPTNHFISKDSETNLNNIFEKLFLSNGFKDIIFTINDKKIHAHKAVLAIRSPVFAVMFEHQMKELNENSVDIKDIDYEIFEALLRYIYTNQVPNIDNIAMQLLPAADKYGLEGLKELCTESLWKNTTVENAANILIIAELHNAQQLVKLTRDFINERPLDVMKTSGYETMENKYPKLGFGLYRIFAKKKLWAGLINKDK